MEYTSPTFWLCLLPALAALLPGDRVPMPVVGVVPGFIFPLPLLHTDYADVPGRLNTGGAAENTRTMARLLQNNTIWTEEEHTAILHSAGWNADGTPATR